MGDYNDALLRNQNAAVQARTKGGTRANVIQLKLIGQSHPTGLTANLLKLFEPRPPLEFKPPPEKRKCLPYTGMAQFVSQFAEPGDPEYAPPVQKGETPAERKARIHKIRLEEGAKKAAEELESYDPNNDPNVSGDPYKTLFVARLSYETTESRIKKEFEAYGPIKRVRLVTDKSTSRPRGYAFIEYAHTRDMKAAYKQADGKKIDNRRVLVDVERGRTVPNWRPRRLGGGLGTTRVGGEELNQKNSGREIVQSAGPPSRSEEPRVRDDRDRDREKSRERVRESREREREPEKVRERSQDRTRDREHREERHHRDRDRTRDRDRSGRDSHRRDRDRGGRDRGRDHDRDHREKSRDRHREREKDKDREYDAEYEYDKAESKHEKDRTYDPADEDNHGGWYEQSERKRKRPEGEHGHYDYAEAPVDDDRYKENDGYDRYDQVVDEDKYGYEQDAADPREKDRSYQQSERSRSRDY